MAPILHEKDWYITNLPVIELQVDSAPHFGQSWRADNYMAYLSRAWTLAWDAFLSREYAHDKALWPGYPGFFPDPPPVDKHQNI